MISAVACRMVVENLGAIASEKPDFNREEALQWIADNGEGYFIRDESSHLDCKYVDDQTFREMYMFADGDVHSLFRRILKR